MNRLAFAFYAATALSIGSGNTFASTWTEPWDAGSLPVYSQSVSGVGDLTEIVGTQTSDSVDVDMFRIYITDPQDFHVEALPGVSQASFVLYLFDDEGHGIAAHPDRNGFLSLSFLPELPDPGYYQLAVAGYRLFPYGDTAYGSWAPIFPDSNGTGLMGPVAYSEPKVVTSWGGSGYGSIGEQYIITLKGASFAAPVPEPETWTLLLVGLGLIYGQRYRRTRQPPNIPGAEGRG